MQLLVQLGNAQPHWLSIMETVAGFLSALAAVAAVVFAYLTVVNYQRGFRADQEWRKLVVQHEYYDSIVASPARDLTEKFVQRQIAVYRKGREELALLLRGSVQEQQLNQHMKELIIAFQDDFHLIGLTLNSIIDTWGTPTVKQKQVELMSELEDRATTHLTSLLEDSRDGDYEAAFWQWRSSLLRLYIQHDPAMVSHKNGA